MHNNISDIVEHRTLYSFTTDVCILASAESPSTLFILTEFERKPVYKTYNFCCAQKERIYLIINDSKKLPNK